MIAPAGMENAEGIMSAMYRLEGEDAAAAGPAVFREWSAFMERYVPSVSKSNGQAVGAGRLRGPCNLRDVRHRR